MKLNKEQFLKSEFGSELEGVIKAWDIALQHSSKQPSGQQYGKIYHGHCHRLFRG